LKYAMPAAALLVLVVGGVLRLRGVETAGTAVWMAGLVITGLPIVARTAAGLVRGQFAADIVASLSIVGAAVLQYPVAGLVIVLMQSGGEALEAFAAGRASAAVRRLEQLAPRIGHRVRDGRIDDIAVDAIAVGDELLVRPGELVPCDGIVLRGESHVDTASLTGEPVPVKAHAGTKLMSGSSNQEGPLSIRATAPARESQYLRIVELVRTAQGSKAPIQRVADRYAVWFTPITLALCLVTWLVTRDSARVLAVLVVATPCPLLLAAPVAIIGGVNRAARDGIIVRSGAALEQLSTVDYVVLDKTGTLTMGRPSVADVRPAASFGHADALRLAAAVEAASSHLLARSIVEAASVAGQPLPEPAQVVEEAGRGIRGRVEGRAVAVGSRSYVLEQSPASAAGFAALDGESSGLQAFVTVDGAAAAVIGFADRARPDLSTALDRMRAQGFAHFLVLSGDDQENVTTIASLAGIADARGDLLAEDKVTAVRSLVEAGHRVLMVGDGTNDAPAMSTATVGIALAEHGGGITAEAADAVLLRDDLGLLPRAVEISRRTMRITRESIWVGLGLSGVAMVAAAAGGIPPATGALLQEGIDLAVILNALRTAR
jgi:heavy metal translocating P-type ATPase